MSAVVVVARHGERTDYVQRDQGLNWVQEQKQQNGQPWNPPLTPHGKQQARQLGLHLAKELGRLSLPPVTQVFASPLLRCVQTAACTGLVRQIGIEEGLMESINRQWYRSWALKESDGTWGGGPKEIDVDSLHPLAQSPIQQVLQAARTSCTPEPLPEASIDQTYTAQTKISEPYSFPNHVESGKSQRLRMKSALELLTSSASGETPTTTLLVSHGGPVTHLYEELTGQSWKVHGDSSYCCYSIYVKKDSSEVASCWEPIQVNQSGYLNEENLHTDTYM